MKIFVAFDAQFVHLPPSPCSAERQTLANHSSLNSPWMIFVSYSLSVVSKNSIRLLCLTGVTLVLTSADGSSFSGASVDCQRRELMATGHALPGNNALLCGRTIQRTILSKFILSKMRLKFWQLELFYTREIQQHTVFTKRLHDQ